MIRYLTRKIYHYIVWFNPCANRGCLLTGNTYKLRNWTKVYLSGTGNIHELVFTVFVAWHYATQLFSNNSSVKFTVVNYNHCSNKNQGI